MKATATSAQVSLGTPGFKSPLCKSAVSACSLTKLSARTRFAGGEKSRVTSHQTTTARRVANPAEVQKLEGRGVAPIRQVPRDFFFEPALFSQVPRASQQNAIVKQFGRW